MEKYIRAVIFSLILLFPSTAAEASTTYSINDLVENAISLDGEKVTITAEAIGEKMERTGGTWVNVNDGTNSIGVWMDKLSADSIGHFGDYGHKGDTLMITGTFSRACLVHGGEPDIHAETVEITNPGEAIVHRASPAKVIWASILSIAAAPFAIYFLRQSSLRKKHNVRHLDA
ncbi:hypothetical protein [Youngiibacter fragilis]|uniref:OB-fold tRNA/helicase-type nucleic acid binding protein n=1 Tax=Youngiibacter fragilis 232.1 TaxID=994573 RepID=V7I7K8_9CLOT|nr:hypothetical protein [Youngiibacter fragilis]ETA81219.1 OB-fold tRNA/helicase-type nucleic acid binding protein [Youngiibacter fragilis 232.1]